MSIAARLSWVSSRGILGLLCLIGVAGVRPAAADWQAGNAFTHQGELVVNGIPANGSYDFRFQLFQSLTSGTALEPTVLTEDVSVTDGLFSVSLNFGSEPFDGQRLWLEIAVWDSSTSPGSYVILSPRQELTPGPYSLRAKSSGTADAAPWAGITDKPLTFTPSTHSHSSLDAPDGSPANAVYVDNDGNTGIGTTSPGYKLDVVGTINGTNLKGNGSQVTNVNADTLDGYHANSFSDAGHSHSSLSDLSIAGALSVIQSKISTCEDGDAPEVLTVTGGAGADGSAVLCAWTDGYAGGGASITGGAGGNADADNNNGGNGGLGGDITLLGGAGGNADADNYYGGNGGEGGDITLQGGAGGSGSGEYGSSGRNGYVLLNPSGGNVGVGTTSPDASLQVVGNSNGETATALNATIGTAASVNYGVKATLTDLATYQNYAIYGQATGAATERNVGVYASASGSPSYNIGVNAGATGTGVGNVYGANLGAYSGWNNYGAVCVGSGGVNSYGVYASASGGSSSNFAGYFPTGNVYMGGNVGIGTTSPAYKLDVNGTISGTSFVGGSAQLTGDLSETKTSGDVGPLFFANSTGGGVNLSLKAGNGTTSSNYTFMRYIINATSPQEWREGTYGTTDYSVYDYTHSRLGLSIAAADGKVNVVNGLKINGTERISSAGAFTGDGSGITSVNAASVDGIHASSTATANQLLALNSSSKLPASITGDADTVDGSHASAFSTSSHTHSSLDASDGSPTNALYVDSIGRVGVGTTSPEGYVHSVATANSGVAMGMKSVVGTPGTINYGVYSYLPGLSCGASSSSYAYYGSISGSMTNSTGIYVTANGGSSENTGVYGIAGSGSGTNYGGRFYTNGTATSYAVYGNSSGGTANYGAYGYGTGGSTNVGVCGIASGGTNNYAVYASASGGSSSNYAGYFEGGNVYIANNLGIGVVSPSDKLDVNGVLRLRDTTAPTGYTSGCVKFYSSGGRAYANDNANNTTIFSPHADVRELSPGNTNTSFSDATVSLPWSFYHKNGFIGKESIVDMAKLVAWVESKMIAEKGPQAGQIVFERDLPKENVQSVEDFYTAAVEDQIKQKIASNPWVEVTLGADGTVPDEALENVEIIEKVEEEKTVDEAKFDPKSKKIVKIQIKKKVWVEKATGRFESRLKDGYHVSESGQLLRPRMIEDFSAKSVELPTLPQWVLDRVPGERKGKTISKADVFETVKVKLLQEQARAREAKSAARQSAAVPAGAPGAPGAATAGAELSEKPQAAESAIPSDSVKPAAAVSPSLPAPDKAASEPEVKGKQVSLAVPSTTN